MNTPVAMSLPRLEGERSRDERWVAKCLVHDGKKLSLSISEGVNDCVVFHCFAGCDKQTIPGLTRQTRQGVVGYRKGNKENDLVIRIVDIVPKGWDSCDRQMTNQSIPLGRSIW